MRDQTPPEQDAENDRQEEVHQLCNRAEVFLAGNGFKDAFACCEEALAIAKPPAIARVYRLMGTAYLVQGELDLARERYNQALALLYPGDLAGSARVIDDLGLAMWVMGERENTILKSSILWRSLGYHRQALDIYQRLGDTFDAGQSAYHWAVGLRKLNKPQDALAVYRLALSLFAAPNEQMCRARVLNEVSLVLHTLGEKEQAKESLLEALRELDTVPPSSVNELFGWIAHTPEPQDELREAVLQTWDKAVGEPRPG